MTLRAWDAALQAWCIAWCRAGNRYEQQIGRWDGKAIVQLGTRGNGVAARWMFTEITRAVVPLVRPRPRRRRPDLDTRGRVRGHESLSASL